MMTSSIVPILVVSGAATAGAIVLFLAPEPLLRLVFGVDAADGLTIFFARYIGLLVFLFGCLLVYCAFNPATRAPVLVAASTEKLVFVALVAMGKAKRTPLLTTAAIADALFATLYVLYLAGL